MAFGGQAPALQSQDLFTTTDPFHDLEEQGAESSLRVYGATGGSAPIQRPKLVLSEQDTDDIPMHDFQVSCLDGNLFYQIFLLALYINTVADLI